MLRKVLGVMAVSLVPLLIALPGSAMADSGVGAAASGRLTLYSGPNGGGMVQQLGYANCPATLVPDLPRIGVLPVVRIAINGGARPVFTAAD